MKTFSYYVHFITGRYFRHEYLNLIFPVSKFFNIYVKYPWTFIFCLKTQKTKKQILEIREIEIFVWLLLMSDFGNWILKSLWIWHLIGFLFQSENFIEEEPAMVEDEICYGKRCTANEHCCPGNFETFFSIQSSRMSFIEISLYFLFSPRWHPGSVCVDVDGGKWRIFTENVLKLECWVFHHLFSIS